MTDSSGRGITGGVDTHKDTHTAAALDENGRLLGVVNQYVADLTGTKKPGTRTPEHGAPFSGNIEY